MDVTSMLNTASAVSGKVEDVERTESGDYDVQDSFQTPSATTAGSSAPSSMVSTPPSDRTLSRRSSESRTPNRNRTPWDAGGYSLPLALDEKKLIRTSPGAASLPAAGFPACCDSSSPPDTTDLGTASPKSVSPRHKFSDSRSSFSSSYTIASSTTSVSHSRISSLSTVSENQPLATLITDFSLLETGISDPSTAPCFNHPPQQFHQYSASTQSASEGPDLHMQSPTPVRSIRNLACEASPEPSPPAADRSPSPSDAVMISRPGDERNDEGVTTPGSIRLQIPAPHSRLQSRGDIIPADFSPTRRHKRAVSAPDFSSIGPSSFDPRFPTFGPIPEPTPSPSQHSSGNVMDSPEDYDSRSSPTRQDASSAPATVLTPTGQGFGPAISSTTDSTPVAAGPTSLETASSASEQSPPVTEAAPEPPVNFEIASVCMYRGDCQTGSQLRKAISHIFGRNKLCTRMIPTGVWVHYCRKHYQRTRYRNGGEYPQRQIGLVQEQVKRVQAWSDSNLRQGLGPILKDWSLSVRKREQLRLDSKTGVTGKKRPYHDDGEEDEEGYEDDRAEMSGTAVPDWVIAQIGDGYSTTDILAVVERLKTDIDQGRLQQIPDIEILPNIVTDTTNQDSTTSTKRTYTKRRPVGSRAGMGAAGAGGFGSGHRRSQSVNTGALHASSVAMARRRSQPNNYLAPSAMPQRMLHSSELQLPLEKRQRVDNDGLDRQGPGGPQAFAPFEAMPGPGNAPPRPSLGGRLQLAHRPAFGGIRETQAEGQGYYVEGEERFEAAAAAAAAAAASAGIQRIGERQPHATAAADSAGYYEGGRPYSNSTVMAGSYELEVRQDYDRGWCAQGASGYGILPTPSPQRYGGPPVVRQAEPAPYAMNSAGARRGGGMHQRSQSEAGFFHQMQTPHSSRPTSSSGFPPSPFASRNQEPSGAGAPGAPGGYQNQPYQQGGRLGSQPPSDFAAGNEYYDKYNNVQLPPLQSIPALQTIPSIQERPQEHQLPALGSNAPPMGRRMASMTPPRHSRHQSSPAVTRVLPPMQVGAGVGVGVGAVSAVPGRLPPMQPMSLTPADA